MNTRITLICCAIACLLGSAAGGGENPEPRLPPAPKRKIAFDQDILPILSKNCHKCHGPQKQEGGLRLDTRDRAMTGGDSGQVIKPNKGADSLLIQLVAGLEPEESMPPGDEKLSDEQVGLLLAWIDQGADWPDKFAGAASRSNHWAFQPVKRPQVPAVKNPAWIRNPIDAFVLARLEQEGIRPSPEADRGTLIRRLSLDLLGLPPAPAEVDEFLADDRPDAYERLVDRLLASPHFGERWGRHWLDLARYADSDGYEKDTVRPFAWRWRDWLIESINRDQPFDQFTVEQLAGDLLPGATLEQKIATGFHRNTLTNKEGGIDKEEDRVKNTVDRVNTTGTVWLGLSIGCAQCHSHKYDPFAQREYYGLFAFFNSVDEADLPAPLANEQQSYEKAKQVYDAAHAPFAAAQAKFEREELPARQAAWEKTVRPSDIRWTVLTASAATSTGDAKLAAQSDQSFLAGGKNPDTAVYTLTMPTELTGITALRLEVLPDPSLPAKGPGRVEHGNFVLSEFSVKAAAKDKPAESKPVAIATASADFSQQEWNVAAAIDGDSKTGWGVAPQYGQRHLAVFELKEDIGFAGGTILTIQLDQQYGKQHTIGKLRISATTAARPVRSDGGLPDLVTQILAIIPAERNDNQRAELTKHYSPLDAEWKKLADAAETHAKQAPKPPATKAQTLAQTAKPRLTHIHIRGDFLRKGDEVQPHTLAVLHPLKNAAPTQPNRLDLAGWIVDPANPLTPRVTVNLFWQYLFGKGIVATPEDFGTRGEKPSHPELLDWLADEFIQRGWRRKALVKLIVSSAAYRQTSAARPDLADRDANNRLLARQNRLRLEAEIVRDAALTSSGLLARTIGGPSIRPPQPAGISELTYAGSAKWVEATGPDRYRRGMYIHFQRTSPYPMLMTFDTPDSNVFCIRRERSNTPLQALTLLNDTVFFECAQALGRRIVSENSAASTAPIGQPANGIRHGFRMCLSRDPTEPEMAILTKLYGELLNACQANPEAAGKLVGKETVPGAAKHELAAWIALSRAVLNLDEFVTRE